MPRILALAATLALAAGPAGAAEILYATGATHNRLTGFCLGSDGSLASSPKFEIDTVREPRRLRIKNGVLYVVGGSQVAAYRIGAGGILNRIGATNDAPGNDARDVVFNEAGTVMYVPQRDYDRIAGYTLDATGAPAAEFSSCVQGAVLINYLNAAVAPCSVTKNGQPYSSCLYVSADGQPGRIDVHPLADDGRLPTTPSATCVADSCAADVTCCSNATATQCTSDDDCTDDGTCTAACTACCSLDVSVACDVDSDCRCNNGPTDAERSPRTIPVSTRRRIQNPKAFVIDGDFLYVEERARKRILAFQLQPDGTFCDTPAGGDPEECTVVQRKKCAQRTPSKNKPKEQCAASVSNEVLQYEDLVMANETLLGTQFFEGRVDSYRLKPDDRVPGSPRVRLPGGPTRRTEKDVLMTPVRAAVHGRTLYVAAGELDRVIAYPLNQDGTLAASEPFSQTQVLTDSFPNDVAIAVLPGACE